MKTSPHTYILNVVSSDHPGIIAGVSAALYEIEANMDSCSQTVLDGYFTLILMVTLPLPWDADELARYVQSHPLLGDAYKITALAVPERTAAADGQRDADPFVITAFGKDAKGIVHDFCRYLADREINILDFYGRSQNEEFVLVAQVQIPAGHSIAVLQDDLEAIAQERHFTVRLQHNNIFVATNEIRLFE
jgi:glycine cleavage system transcriptional repressor